MQKVECRVAVLLLRNHSRRRAASSDVDASNLTTASNQLPKHRKKRPGGGSSAITSGWLCCILGCSRGNILRKTSAQKNIDLVNLVFLTSWLGRQTRSGTTESATLSGRIVSCLDLVKVFKMTDFFNDGRVLTIFQSTRSFEGSSAVFQEQIVFKLTDLFKNGQPQSRVGKSISALFPHL